MTVSLARHSISIALAALITSVVCSRGGDKVIFSGGNGQAMLPQKTAPGTIPSGANDFRGFGSQQPEISIPFIPQQEQPRPETKKKERPNIFDEPQLFRDPLKENERDRDDQFNSSEEKNHPFSSTEKRDEKNKGVATLTDRFGKPVGDRALSPVRQFDWKPDSETEDAKVQADRDREKSRDQSKGVFASRWGNSQEQERTSPLRMTKEDDGRSRSISGFMPFGSGGADYKREREQKRERAESRAEFEKLINPNFSPLGSRDPTAFAGTTSPFDFKRAPAPALTPVPSVSPTRSYGPSMPFAGQQRGVRAPSFDDLTGNGFGSSAPTPAAPPAVGDTAARQSLMNQPTFRDFPGRRF